MVSWIYWLLFSPLFVQIGFIILKVFGVIDWPWYWEIAPLGVQVVFLGLFIWMLSSIYSGPQ